MKDDVRNDFDTIKSLLTETDIRGAKNKLQDITGAQITELVHYKDANRMTLLHHAANSGIGSEDMKEIVEFLVKKDADANAPDEFNESPLGYAIKTNNFTVVKVLLENGADVHTKDKSGKTPLHHAASNIIDNDMRIVEFLLTKGADLYAIDNRSNTPLDRVRRLQSRNPDAISRLMEIDKNNKNNQEPSNTSIDLGADVNAQNVKGADIVRTLIDLDAGLVNEQDDNGMTLLHHLAASDIGPEDMQKLVNPLAQKGADVNAKDKRGMTPLMFAVSSGNDSVIKVLLELGADVEVKDISENSSLDYAGTDAIKRLLLAHTQKKVAPQNDGGSVEQEPSNTSYYAKLFGSVALITLGIVMASISLPLSPILLAVLVVSFTVVGGIGLFRTFESGMPKEITEAAKNKNNFEIIKQFVKSDNFTEVKKRLRDMNDTELKQLIRHKHRETDEMTLLHLLADHADKGEIKPIVDFLVQKGADVNTKDIKGRTPLDCYNAASMRKGANPYNNQIAKSLTPEQQSDFYTLISLLRDGEGAAVIAQLQKMDDTTACRKDGNDITLLHYLAASSIEPKEMKDVFELLLAKGADINARDNIISDSPVGYVIRHKNVDMAKLLNEKGAEIKGIERSQLTALINDNPLSSSEMLRGKDRNAAETQEGDAARSADAEETTDPSQGSGLST